MIYMRVLEAIRSSCAAVCWVSGSQGTTPTPHTPRTYCAPWGGDYLGTWEAAPGGSAASGKALTLPPNSAHHL